MHNQLRHLAVCLTNVAEVRKSRDPADNFLLALAKAGEADFLASGDKRDLLALEEFHGTKIVTARALLEILRVP
jgi:predicted nucleic acid-binding protein